MTVRYAPGLLDRLNERREQLAERVREGHITADEGQVLFEHDVSEAIKESKKPKLRVVK